MRGEAVGGGFPGPGFYSLPGIEQARAYLRGLVPRPPLSHLLGLRVTQVGVGNTGQEVEVGDRDDEWPEFIFVTTDTGSGSVPAPGPNPQLG